MFMLHAMRTGDENGQQNLRNSGSKPTSFLAQRLYIETEVAYGFNPISYRVLGLFLWEIFDNILRDSWQLSVKWYLPQLSSLPSPQKKKKKKKVRLLPLFYRRRISGLTKVNFWWFWLETIKPGFKSNLFVPRDSVSCRTQHCAQLRFHFYTKGPFHCSLILDSAVRGLGESFPPGNFHISCDWLDIILYEFFFSTHGLPPSTPLTFCLFFAFTAT